jgi:tetratricopeptide (TPR) repeat protein
MTEQEREQILALYQAAVDDLEQEDYEAALHKAASLREVGFSGAYEIEAHVHRERHDLNRALAVLRQAPPQVFVLQLLLGSTLCDLGRHQEAIAVYESARTLPNSDQQAVDFNLAISYARMAQHEQALRRCPQPDEGDMREACLSLRVGSLCQLEQWHEAAQLAQQALRSGALQESAPFWYALALQAWRVRANQAETLRLGLCALRAAPYHEPTERLLREALGSDSQRFRLMAHGIWHQEVDGYLPCFYRTFFVEAPDLPSAQRLAAEQEPPEVRAGMVWQEVETMGPFPSGVGLIAVSGHLFYDPQTVTP